MEVKMYPSKTTNCDDVIPQLHVPNGFLRWKVMPAPTKLNTAFQTKKNG